jgi:hypothetical protein
MRSITLGFVLLLVFDLSSPGLRADEGANLILNSGFEDAADAPATFSLFIAPDSEGDHCRFTISSDTFHSGKQSALMQADDFARFALSPQVSYPVVAGDLYRVGVWIKAGADFQMQPDSPGVVLRLNLTAGSPSGPATAGFTFVYPNNTVSQAGSPDFAPLPLAASVPEQWTHVEAVIKVPTGVDFVRPELFFWKAKGSLDVDDFGLQKVDPTTPATPVAGGSPQ